MKMRDCSIKKMVLNEKPIQVVYMVRYKHNRLLLKT